MSFVRLPIQITIASFLSYLLSAFCCRWLTGEPTQLASLWAIISAVLVVQDSVANTIDAFKTRMIASLMGSVTAVLFYMIFEISVWGIAVSILIATLFCILFKLEKYMRLACITLILILLVHHLSPLPHQPVWYFSFWRLFDSFIGSILALLVVSTVPVGPVAQR